MTAAVKEFLEAYGPVLVPWPTFSHDMDPIEHALDDFGRAIINRDNLPLTLHELAQAPTKDSDALDITLWTVFCDLLMTLLSQEWPYLILNFRMQ